MIHGTAARMHALPAEPARYACKGIGDRPYIPAPESACPARRRMRNECKFVGRFAVPNDLFLVTVVLDADGGLGNPHIAAVKSITAGVVHDLHIIGITHVRTV